MPDLNSRPAMVLSVKRGASRADDPDSDMADAEFRGVRDKVLRRDKFTCRYCGWRARRHQQVHHMDDDHANNLMSNLATVCCLCHASQHVAHTGLTGRGVIVLFDPSWLDQASLNQIVRSLWLASEQDENELLAEYAVDVLESIREIGATAAEQVIGTSDAASVGWQLAQLSDEDYARRHEFMKGFLVLPLRGQFPSQMAYWLKSSGSGAHWPEAAARALANRLGGVDDEKMRRILLKPGGHWGGEPA